jgi:hypothetical protein
MRVYLDLEKESGGAPAMTAHSSLVQQIAVLYAGTVSEGIFKGPAVFRRSIEDRMNVHVLLEGVRQSLGHVELHHQITGTSTATSAVEGFFLICSAHKID